MIETIDQRRTSAPGTMVSCTRMLASVTSVTETNLCLAERVDLIDCKDPSAGALGALAPEIISDIVGLVGGRVSVSATVGDLACAPGPIVEAAKRTAALGVDFVKVGFFADGVSASSVARVIDALGQLELESARLVGVLFGDDGVDLAVLERMKSAGFAGVMVDTAHKQSGSLREAMGAAALGEFVREGQAQGLFVGLAGSLRVGDIAGLLELHPDILGFRGALCVGGSRVSGIDVEALATVRRAIPIEKFGPSGELGQPNRYDSPLRNASPVL